MKCGMCVRACARAW